MKQFIVITVILCSWQFCNCYSSFFSPNSRSTIFARPPPDFTTEKPTTTAVPDARCEKAGMMCKNCGELVNCVEVTTGNYIQVETKNCSTADREFCLIDECSTAPNPLCTLEGAAGFKCHNTGVYPDPSDCRVYHMCVEEKNNLEANTQEKHIPVHCDDGYAYNPVSTYCDRRLQGNQCTDLPIEQCTELGRMGSVEGTSIFYVCSEEEGNFIPHMYMCPAGGRFSDGTCIGNDA